MGTEDKDSRFSDCKWLMNKGFDEFQVVTPDLPEQMYLLISVNKGLRRKWE